MPVGGMPLLVCTQFRWSFLYGRLQHLLTRLAATRPIYVIEAPVFNPGGAPQWVRSQPAPNLTLLQPHTPEPSSGFSAAQAALLTPMLAEWLAAEGLGRVAIWVDSVAAWPMVQALPAAVTVYDCVEASPAEVPVLAWADLVLTNGPSLHRALSGLHARLYHFPNSVTAADFVAARPGSAPGWAEPSDQALLEHPRLGYYGRVDDRLDWETLTALAHSHPLWEIVLLGPVTRLDPTYLPRPLNLSYFGWRPYEQLPAYLAGWDVALLPFARTAATRCLNPAQLLEYAAAEKPIVATPLPDVVATLGDAVYLGDAVDSFINACERALAATAEERPARAAQLRAVVTGTSWDATAEAIATLLDRTAADKPT